jgi:hypothetical protein
MKLDLAKKRVAESEAALADELEKVGERHRVEHDVFHMTRTLAERSRARLARLNGGSVDSRQEEAGSSLLEDLRRLYILASEASIDWTILGQGAQAAKDAELLALVDECHADELRTLKWATTRVKETAPQVFTS